MYRKGTANKFTTLSLPSSTSDQSATTKAVGYVRVSTDMQAQEGVSLEAQRMRVQAYCVASGIKLVEIISDELSGKSLARPGLRRALDMLDQGKASAIVVVKLDRLTRSVLDLGTLLQNYFLVETSPGQLKYSLLSVTESLDTRNAIGRLMLNLLASMAQWERETISERTRDAMRHLKAQGVKLGPAPYGLRYAPPVDGQGRRMIEPDPEKQEVIKRILAMHEQRVPREAICATLNEERVPGPRGAKWHPSALHRVLQREGKQPARVRDYKPRPLVQIKRDKSAAAARARCLRDEGISLRQIAEHLRREGLYPPRGNRWHAATISDLLQIRSPKDTARRAIELRSEGHSLREVGRRLLYEGYLPPSGGLWDCSALAHMVAAN